MLARAALACVVLTGMIATARADRRPVAVVNLDLSPDSAANAEVKKLDAALDQNPRLRRVSDTHDENGLEDYFAPEEVGVLEDAHRDLLTARGLLDQYDITEAIKSATHGIDQLNAVSPQAALHPFADLVFVRGVAKLGTKQPHDATADFVLVKRLVPDFKLADDLLPEIVTAFDRAKPPAGTGELDVHGSGRVWIDGAERGDAPGIFAVDAGEHLVQLTGPERYPRGNVVEVAKDSSQITEIPDRLLPPDHLAYRARVAIVNAADPIVRAEAIQRLAHLVDVHDIVLVDVVTDAHGATRLTEQTWQDDAGLSAVHAPDDPGALLDVLAPPPPPPPFEPPPIQIPIGPPPVPWYRERSWQGGLGFLGITAIVITGVALVQRTGSVPVNPALQTR